MNQIPGTIRDERRTSLHSQQQAILHQVQALTMPRPRQMRPALRPEQGRRQRAAQGARARAEAAEVLVRFDVPPVSNPF
jgi:hypothetical protein